MKIVFISKYNDGYLRQLSEKNMALESYHDSIKTLMNDFYYHYGTLCYYLNELGHKTELIIPNFEALQNLWCIENNVDPSMSSIEIIKSQINQFNPDIVFLSSNFEYYDPLIPFFKKRKIKICAWISCPIPKHQNLNGIDHIFTLFEPHYQKFRSLGIEATLTHGGFDERLIQHFTNEKKHATTFIGGIGGYHKNRERLLKKILQKQEVKIWGYGFVSNTKLKSAIKKVLQGFAFKKFFQGEAWGKEMFTILNQSNITLNIHGDITGGEHAVNMRLFEATGAGTLLLTDSTSGINHFFEDGKEIVIYESAEDAVEKINYYLANPTLAQKIANAGQKKTLEKYNYKLMINEYEKVFLSLMNK